MNLDLMFSSEDMTWATPQDFFDKLDKEFHFTLDPCCVPETAKCDTYFTPKEDGLKQSWQGHTVFMNPPYGKPEKACKPNCKKKKCVERGFHIEKYVPGQADWIKKAYEESLNGTTVVCLIPSRTDTDVWNDYCMKASEIRFVKGRLKFGEGDSPAPFPSAIVVFNGNNECLKVSTYNI